MTANELFRLFNQMTYEEREQFIMVFTKYCKSIPKMDNKEQYLND